MRAKDKQTATENVSCLYFIIYEKTSEKPQMEGGGNHHPPCTLRVNTYKIIHAIRTTPPPPTCV